MLSGGYDTLVVRETLPEERNGTPTRENPS